MALEPTRIPIRSVVKEVTTVGPDVYLLVDDSVSMGKAKASNAIDARARTVAQQEIAALDLDTASQQPVAAFAPAAQAVPAGGTTGQVLAKNSGSDNDVFWTSAGTGDMQEAIYDPTNVGADAFDSANHEYDNTASGLTADHVQGAIDEIADRVPALVADTMLIDNAAGTARESKTFAEVRAALEVPKWDELPWVAAWERGVTGNGSNEAAALQAIIDSLPPEGGGIILRGDVFLGAAANAISAHGRRNILLRGLDGGGYGAGADQRTQLRTTAGAM